MHHTNLVPESWTYRIIPNKGAGALTSPNVIIQG